jgi:signal transduction histidine kinase
MDISALLEDLRRQQAALATFGSFAFREVELDKILTEAARVCAHSLRVPFAKICRYRPEENDLLIVAGWGWHEGVIGKVISQADETSPQGRAFITGLPVILGDVAENGSLTLPSFYAEHGIVATVDVLIKGHTGSWGVLEADSTDRRRFDEHDIIFLTGFANVMAEAAATAERTAAMQCALAKMERLVVDKDELLAERVGRELKLHELQTELLHVTRLNAMGQMTAAIAHELNQPLAAIANYIGAAKRLLDTDAIDSERHLRLRGLVEKVQSQTLRAGSIIKNLKDVVEKRESHRSETKVEEVVRDSLAMVTYDVTDRNVTVQMAFDPTAATVLVDKVQIQQILVNLIRNAVEAMYDAPERILTLSTAPGKAGFVHVMVRDTAPGLAANVLERLFQPFNTTKPSGMGLGLTVCQTLAEANGGRLWHVEDQAKGARFCLSLPQANGPVPAQEPKSGERYA